MRIRHFPRIALVALFPLLAACGNDSTTPGAVASVGDLPADNVIHDLTHRMTRDGVRTAELSSDTAFYFDGDRRFDLQGVNLVFFHESGQQSGTLTSLTGEYRVGSGAFIARGDVVLITEGEQGQRRVETEELHFDVAGDQIWSDVDFVMRDGGRITRGTSFRTDTQFERWTIANARTEGGAAAPTGGISF
jgi:LPS export ABC transporter protein LptC